MAAKIEINSSILNLDFEQKLFDLIENLHTAEDFKFAINKRIKKS